MDVRSVMPHVRLGGVGRRVTHVLRAIVIPSSPAVGVTDIVESHRTAALH